MPKTAATTRADDEHHPEREVLVGEARRREGIRVRADREERGVAEVEQAGKADDDVQAERQQDEDSGRGERRRSTPAVALKPLSGGSVTMNGRIAVTIAIPRMIEIERWRPRNWRTGPSRGG